jgi:hypothetical protein
MTEASSRYVAETLRMLAGLLIWAAHLTVIYGITALACARRFDDVRVLGIGIVPLTIAIATLIAMLATGLVLWLAVRDLGEIGRTPQGEGTRRFFSFTTATVAGLSMVAIAWQGLPVLMIPPCD